MSQHQAQMQQLQGDLVTRDQVYDAHVSAWQAALQDLHHIRFSEVIAAQQAHKNDLQYYQSCQLQPAPDPVQALTATVAPTMVQTAPLASFGQVAPLDAMLAPSPNVPSFIPFQGLGSQLVNVVNQLVLNLQV